MKKILNKIRKVLIGIGASLISFGTRVFGAKEELINIEELPAQPAYAAESYAGRTLASIVGIIQVLIVPAIFIIGLIYCIKKQKKKEEKIKIIIILLVSFVALFLILTFIRLGLINLDYIHNSSI